MPGAWVYILHCADGSYYTGLTNHEDPQSRVWEHNNRVHPDAYTARRLPVTLAYAEFYESLTDAIAAERRIKGWSRAKKQAMMKGDWESLVRLSKRRSGV